MPCGIKFTVPGRGRSSDLLPVAGERIVAFARAGNAVLGRRKCGFAVPVNVF